MTDLEDGESALRKGSVVVPSCSTARPVRTLFLIALAALLAASAAGARADDVDARLRGLEERVRALEEENARLRAGAAPADAPPVAKTDAAAPLRESAAKSAEAPATPKPEPPIVRAAGKPKEVKVGGFLQVQAEAGARGDARFTDADDRVLPRRARLSVAGRLTEEVEWRTELELAGSLADASGLRAQLTDGYVAWKRTPRLELRGGQFKTPFGYEHLFSDTKLALIERTLGSDRLTLGRQAGLQLSGAEREGRFAWSFGAFDGTPQNSSGNDDDRALLAARVSGTPATWKAFGHDARWTLGAGAHRSRDAQVALAPELGFDFDPARAGSDAIFAGRRHGFGADSQLALGPFELGSEWLATRFEADNDVPSDDLDARALMTQAAFTTWHDKLIVAARWDAFDPDTDRRGDARRTWTGGLGWLVRGHDLKLQANWMDVSGPGSEGGGRLLLRLQVLF
jgi:phosphate-selective porin